MLTTPTTAEPSTPLVNRDSACLARVYPRSIVPEWYPLGSTHDLIGRDRDCSVLIRDKTVSRFHAEIELINDRRQITNRSVEAPIKINGHCAPAFVLRHLDQIQIGRIVLQYLEKGSREAEHMYDRFERFALDVETGARNQQALIYSLTQELKSLDEIDHDLSLLMLDIDDVDAISERLGEDASDWIMRSFCAHVQKLIRARRDVLGRYSENSFGLLLPATSQEGSEVVAQRIRESLDRKIFRLNQRRFGLEVNIGIASTGIETRITGDRLLDQARLELERARDERDGLYY